MEPSILSAAQEAYEIDYPGFIRGQCIDYDHTEPTYMVFDSSPDKYMWLQFRQAEVPLGRTADLADSMLVRASPLGNESAIEIPAAVSSSPEQADAHESLETEIASAITVPYDELFRNNEDYVGKIVRYVGQIAQTQETTCLLCLERTYALRLLVTPQGYGIWSDAIWVDYTPTERFLDEDIVTVWGKVTGLESYIAVLGNEITIPKIEALAVKLGDVASPVVALPPGTPYALKSANLRGGPGTDYAVEGGVTTGQELTLVGRTLDSTWYKLSNGMWIASFLVGNAPISLPVAED